LTGQDDIVVGIAAAEPAGASGNNLVGYATNLLPLRSRINESLTFADHLIAVKQMVFDAYHHQNYSLIRLIEKLNLKQDLSRPPLISTLFNMDYAGAELVLHGLEVEMFSHPSGAVECDTFWNITDADNGLFVECYYNTDLFDGQTIQRWLGHYQAVLSDLITHPCQRLTNVVI
jgi:non-ribosomal peptide synthetase component F